MRDVVVTEFITLDGVIEAPGPAEDFEAPRVERALLGR